jgi:hypothetical protein
MNDDWKYESGVGPLSKKGPTKDWMGFGLSVLKTKSKLKALSPLRAKGPSFVRPRVFNFFIF